LRAVRPEGESPTQMPGRWQMPVAGNNTCLREAAAFANTRKGVNRAAAGPWIEDQPIRRIYS